MCLCLLLSIYPVQFVSVCVLSVSFILSCLDLTSRFSFLFGHLVLFCPALSCRTLASPAYLASPYPIFGVPCTCLCAVLSPRCIFFEQNKSHFYLISLKNIIWPPGGEQGGGNIYYIRTINVNVFCLMIAWSCFVHLVLTFIQYILGLYEHKRKCVLSCLV